MPDPALARGGRWRRPSMAAAGVGCDGAAARLRRGEHGARATASTLHGHASSTEDLPQPQRQAGVLARHAAGVRTRPRSASVPQAGIRGFARSDAALPALGELCVLTSRWI